MHASVTGDAMIPYVMLSGSRKTLAVHRLHAVHRKVCSALAAPLCAQPLRARGLRRPPLAGRPGSRRGGPAAASAFRPARAAPSSSGPRRTHSRHAPDRLLGHDGTPDAVLFPNMVEGSTTCVQCPGCEWPCTRHATLPLSKIDYMHRRQAIN